MASPFSVLEQLESAQGALRAKSVAKILDISLPSVYRGAETGAIPCYRVMGALRFDPKVLSFWYRKQSPMVAAAGKAAL